MRYVTSVLMPKNLPRFLSDKDIAELFSSSGQPKKSISVRLSGEALRVLDEEATRYGGLKRGATLELLLREIRELRKRKR